MQIWYHGPTSVQLSTRYFRQRQCELADEVSATKSIVFHWRDRAERRLAAGEIDSATARLCLGSCLCSDYKLSPPQT